MTILGVGVLAAFESKYAPARRAFSTWLQVVETAEWSNWADVKATFSSADYVKPYFVFNVGGHKYRIITLVKFPLKLIQIDHALTHEQYNKWKP